MVGSDPISMLCGNNKQLTGFCRILDNLPVAMRIPSDNSVYDRGFRVGVKDSLEKVIVQYPCFHGWLYHCTVGVLVQSTCTQTIEIACALFCRVAQSISTSYTTTSALKCNTTLMVFLKLHGLWDLMSHLAGAHLWFVWALVFLLRCLSHVTFTAFWLESLRATGRNLVATGILFFPPQKPFIEKVNKD